MALFVVAYDLKNADTEDYKALKDALDRMDSVHTQESVWYVDRASSSKGLYDLLKPHMSEGDKLMVVEFSKKPTWNVGLKGTKDWIDRKFP